MPTQQTKVCANCGRTFARGPGMTRWSTRLFCDRRCRGEAARRHEFAPKTCPACGTVFTRPRTQSGILWERRVYCSTRCGWDAKIAVSPSDKTGRGHAQRLFPEKLPCERCGKAWGPGSGRHHIDGDRAHNVQSNLAWLCRTCHADAHRSLDGKVGGGPRPRLTAASREATVARARQARALLDAGEPLTIVAALMDVHYSSVLRWFRKYGV